MAPLPQSAQVHDHPLAQTAVDQHVHGEAPDHAAEQFLPTSQSTGPSAPAEPRTDPAPPATPPTQSTTVSAPAPSQQLDEPTVRQSGRAKTLNTRLQEVGEGS